MSEQPQSNPEQQERVDATRFDIHSETETVKFHESDLPSLEIGRAVREVNNAYPSAERVASLEVRSAQYIGVVGLNLSKVRSNFELAA